MPYVVRTEPIRVTFSFVVTVIDRSHYMQESMLLVLSSRGAIYHSLVDYFVFAELISFAGLRIVKCSVCRSSPVFCFVLKK